MSYIEKIKPKLSTTHFDTIIPGDIHLGSTVSRPLALIEFLSSIKMRRLVHQGDTFNHHELFDLQREHLTYLSFVRELEQEGVEVVWVAGNHDTPLLPLLDRFYRTGTTVYEEYEWSLKNRRFLVLHGHVFDKILATLPITSKVATWIYEQLQRIDNEEQQMSAFLKQRSKTITRLSEILALEACAYGVAKNADVIICGHSHQLRHDKFGEKSARIHYVNAGCWTEKNCGTVAIDANGKIHLLRIKTRRKNR